MTESLLSQIGYSDMSVMSCQYILGMKRNEVLQFRVTAEEKAQIEANAKEAAVTPSEWMRIRSLGHGGSLGRVALPEEPLESLSAEPEPSRTESPELTKLVKRFEAQPNVSPAQAQVRARRQLGL